jgi:hypothetical protein
MSIYCYINNDFKCFPSTEISNIQNLTEFKDYIKSKLNINCNLIIYSHFSEMGTINNLTKESKVNNNYLVITENDCDFIKFINKNNYYNQSYLVPRKMNVGLFKKLLSDNNVIIYNGNNIMEDDAFLNKDKHYIYSHCE